MNLVKTFDEIHKNDIPSVGGKGANLGEMVSAGITVPPGFVVTADAYRLFLKENHLDTLFLQTLQDAGNDSEKLRLAAAQFREKILSAALPDTITTAITSAYNKLASVCGTNAIRVAVRSSATAEDLPDSSFAGQQETYLNVTSLPDVFRQIVACYASLWGDRAVSYRHTRGYDQTEVALAVVIQEMVESETAGVLFTVNPVSGNPEEMQINASYGLGEAVVSGHVTPDTYVCDKNGTLLQTTLGQKSIEILYAENGTKEVPVSDSRQKEQALTTANIRNLCEQAVQIEQHYGCPMDIEWAIRNGQVYILQARAITTLAANEASQEEASEIEQYLKKNKVSKAYQKVMPFLLEKIPDAFYPFDSDMADVINSQKSVIMAKAGIVMSMQPQMDDDGIELLPPSGKRITKDIFKIFKIIKELKDFEHCQQVIDQQMPAFQKECNEIMDLPVDTMDLAACGQTIEHIYKYVGRLSYFRFYYAMFPGMLASRICGRVLRQINPDYTGYDLLQNLNNRTAEAARDTVTLASQIMKQPAVADAIKSGTNYADICKKHPEIIPAFHTFLDKHGYTTDFNTYCLHVKSFHEFPDRLLHILRPLLAEKQQPEKPEQFDALMQQVRSHISADKYTNFEQDVKYSRSFHVAREESQYLWETAFYMMRRVMKRASFLCTGNEDYFSSLAYLYYPEVCSVCKQGGLDAVTQEKIDRRKAKRPLAEKVWEQNKLLVFPDTGDVLKGVSGSTGEAVGKACIISGPEEFYKLEKGDVLVCKLTDPEWTPLFTLASAVVADTGAALSHAAIVAREYGIPAVLGVGHATSKLKDGDMIRVNGTTGEISRLS